MKTVPIRSPKRVQLRMVPLDRLEPTPDNRRRPITQASVESLARSLTREGVLQPIVVRPHPQKEGWFEIRAGERRWRAARLAGLKELPAVVRALDDESALSVTIAENLQPPAGRVSSARPSRPKTPRRCPDGKRVRARS